ncbi:MAG: CvpA family protein [Gaiellales bacterium]
MTGVDLVAVIWIALSALIGARRGLVGQIVSLCGFAAGAFLGSRIAPHLLGQGNRSPWLPAAGLAGALVGGLLVQTLAGSLVESVRRRVMAGPLATLDGLGGGLAGAVLGVAAVWLVAAAAVQQPELGLRRLVQRSTLLPALIHALPPQSVLDALARFDPLPVLPSQAGRALPPPNPGVPRSAGAERARLSVVRVEGTSCGLGVQGSGWVIRPGLIATNAHVIAGETDTHVVPANGGASLGAVPAYVDAGNDVALLRVPGLSAAPLRLHRDAPSGIGVALIGYPGGGPQVSAAGTAGTPVGVIAPNAYDTGVGPRTVVPLRGPLRHGDSGGPAVDRLGRVVTMMFAASRQPGIGYGVPLDPIVNGLTHLRARVPSGPCTG